MLPGVSTLTILITITPMMILLLEIPRVPLFSIAMFPRRMIFLMAVLATSMAIVLLRRRRWFRRCRRRFRTMLPLLFIIRHVHIVIVASLFDTDIVVPRSSRCRRRITVAPQKLLQVSIGKKILALPSSSMGG
jgi:hypothetical protein